MRKLQIVPLSRMEEMRKYFYEYLTELSQFDTDIEFDERGTPIYEWFDCYWSDSGRYPIFLVIDGEVAGLTLIREIDNMLYEIAEFYVRPEFRKEGNAMWFANALTELFEGQFDFSTCLSNQRAVKFWSKFIQSFEQCEYTDDDTKRNWCIRKNAFSEHTLNLAPQYFELIKSGEKTLEGRLNDEKRQNFNIGDKITFYKEPEKIETMLAIILQKYLFKDFDEMADSLDKKLLGFENSTKQQMVDVYRTIYTTADENKHGVVVFKIKTID